MNKIMSRDELEERLHLTNSGLTEINERLKKIKDDSFVHEPEKTFANTLYLYLESNKEIIDSHLALLDQIESNRFSKDKEITVADYHVTKDKLDQAVALLQMMVKSSLIYTPNIGVSGFRKCNHCGNYVPTHDGSCHRVGCPVGKAQAFMKEVKGHE